MWSLVYLLIRTLVALFMRTSRPDRDDGAKDLEILVLRHQLRVLRRTAGGPRLRTIDRVLLAAASRAIPRDRWVAFLVTPSAVLLDRRRHAHLAAVHHALPFTSRIDRDAVGKVLALAHPDLQEPVDDEVVDLGRAAAALEAEIVDRRDIRVVRIAELDLVGGVALTLGAGPGAADLLLDGVTRLGIKIGSGGERDEHIELRLFRVGRLDQHQEVPELGAPRQCEPPLASAQSVTGRGPAAGSPPSCQVPEPRTTRGRLRGVADRPGEACWRTPHPRDPRRGARARVSHPDASIGMILEAQAQAQRRLLLDDQRSLDPMAAFEVNSRRTTQEMEQVERFNADPSWRRGRIRDVVAAREVAIEINSTLWRGLSARATELEDAFGDPEAARRAFDSMPSFDVSVSLKTAYHRDPSHRWKPNDIQDIDALSSTVPYCDIVVTDKEAASHLVQTGVSDRLQTIVLSNLADLARHVYGRDDRSAVYTPVDVRR